MVSVLLEGQQKKGTCDIIVGVFVDIDSRGGVVRCIARAFLHVLFILAKYMTDVEQQKSHPGPGVLQKHASS